MRDVLAVATRYPDWDAGLAYAARLAASFDAALTGLVTVPLPSVPVPYFDGGAVLGQYTALLDGQLRSARALEPAFASWAQAQGVAHPRWMAAQGEVATLLRYVGAWHDLLVVGAARGDPWTEPGGLAEMVLCSQLPCLVVPTPADAPPRRVAVAWNGSIESIRALHAAVPLLQRAGRVVLLVGAASAAIPVQSFDLERWCERHGLAPDLDPLPRDADGAAILAAAHATGAQLLVMGAYGRSRLSEWALGGVTRYMLQHADLPLLLRH